MRVHLHGPLVILLGGVRLNTGIWREGHMHLARRLEMEELEFKFQVGIRVCRQPNLTSLYSPTAGPATTNFWLLGGYSTSNVAELDVAALIAMSDAAPTAAIITASLR
ncbi:hypothetical protein FRB91_010541 [Serendipita sp. 411]|nr:hypothetical protein FRB91_010541 [Serendipita sp. 411]